MNRTTLRVLVAPLLVLAPLASARAQETSDPDLPFTVDGPAPPVPPAVISRDAAGRATVRAVRLTTPLRIDGQLDEGVYQSVPSLSGFIQTEPVSGVSPTEQTEVWVFFDRDQVYVSVRCWESHPERMVANEMRRDHMNIIQNDQVGFFFDTFYDRRNAVVFNVNPIGGRMDGQITDERGYNSDWNPIWDVATGRFEGGWAVEAAIPFKSLRYRPGRAQVWGFQLRRENRWRNEVSFLTRVPDGVGTGGLMEVSFAATLVGLEVPEASRNLDIKPYAISEVSGDRNATPEISNDLGGDLGLDVKYGVTQNLTADLTVNTDFAQVEADTSRSTSPGSACSFPRSGSSSSRTGGCLPSAARVEACLAAVAATRPSCSTAARSDCSRARRCRSRLAAG